MLLDAEERSTQFCVFKSTLLDRGTSKMRCVAVEKRASLQRFRDEIGAERAQNLFLVSRKRIGRFARTVHKLLRVWADFLARFAPKMQSFDVKICRTERDFDVFCGDFGAE